MISKFGLKCLPGSEINHFRQCGAGMKKYNKMKFNYVVFEKICEPEGTRTPNLLVRSQMLYPIKLQVLLLMRTQI